MFNFLFIVIWYLIFIWIPDHLFKKKYALEKCEIWVVKTSKEERKMNACEQLKIGTYRAQKLLK